MQEALQMVRDELGPDAALLHTREVPRRGIMGLLGGTELECSATDDQSIPSRFEMLVGSSGSDPIEPPQPPEEPQVEQESHDLAYSDDGLDLECSSFNERFFGQASKFEGELGKLFDHLIKADVPAELATSMCVELKTSAPLDATASFTTLCDMLRNTLANEIVIGRDMDQPRAFPRIVAAIGPTGVGKTTTVAKLAARAKFEHRRRVGLVTVDTYRIAAVDQLQTYAEIMDLPMKVVATPMEIRSAIDELDDCDQIFIDTAGRSPRDDVQVQHLKSILKAASPDEVYLVLSATSSTKSIRDSLQRFEMVHPTSWVLTKIDEMEYLGSALNLLLAKETPLAYVTNGQEVPHAIAAADGEQIARQVV